MAMHIYTDGSSPDAPDWSPLSLEQRLANVARNYLTKHNVRHDHIPDEQLVKRIRRAFEQTHFTSQDRAE